MSTASFDARLARRAWGLAGLLVLLGHGLLWILDPDPYYMLGDSIGYLQTIIEPVPSLKAPLGYALTVFVPVLAVSSVQMIVLVQVCVTLATGLAGAAIVHHALGARAVSSTEADTRSTRLRALLPPATFALLALWPRHAYYAHTVLSECVASFWVLATAALLVMADGRRKPLYFAGIALAGAVLSRSAAFVLLPGVLAVLWFVPLRRRADRETPGGAVRRKAAETLMVALGLATLLVPYAGVNRAVNGGFTLTAFDGWTLFGTVGAHVEVSAIEDPEVREIFETHEEALTEMSPSALRWSARSPAVALDRHYRAGYVDHDVRASLRRFGFTETLRTMWRQAPHPEIETNRVLRAIALRTVVDHPGAYVTGVLSRFGTYWLGRDRYLQHFQSLDGTGDAERNFRLPRLRRVLRGDYATDVPATGRGLLLRLRYVAYDLRLLPFVPVVWLLFVRVRRRSRAGLPPDLLALLTLALSLSLGTALVAEIYDRYTVVTDGLVLAAAMVSLGWLGCGYDRGGELPEGNP